MSKGNMLLGYARGKVGSLVFLRRKNEQITRSYNSKPANPNTMAQSAQRVQLANLVSFYRAVKALLGHSFTDAKPNQSSYNAFVAANLNSIRVYLSKEAAHAHAAVVAPYVVSSGILPSIQVQGVGANATTNIAVGDVENTDDMTIGAFTRALIDNNNNIEEGMQLSYVSLVQENDVNTGFPVVVPTLSEITLDLSSQELLADYLPVQSRAVRGGFLAHGALVAQGGFAWILSKKDASGKTIASTQRIVVTSPSVYAGFSSANAAIEATRSYGASAEYYLTPGGTDANSSSIASANPSVANVNIEGIGSLASAEQTDLSAGDIPIKIAGSNLAALTDVQVRFNGSSPALVVDITSSSATLIEGTIPLKSSITTVRKVEILFNALPVATFNLTSSGSGENYPME